MIHPVRALLDGVGQRMPQVELAAVARLVLVAFDNIGLDADRGGNSVRKQVGIGAQGLKRDVFDPGEKIGVGDDGRLDDLGKPRAEFPVGERAQHFGIADHEARLFEGSGHILVPVHIHAVLAAHAGVHLPQQGGRDESERQSAHVSRRGETRHVGHDAAAEADEERRAVGSSGEQLAIELACRPECFVGLAQTDQAVVVAVDDFLVQAVDVRVRHDHDLAVRRQIVLQRVDRVSDHHSRGRVRSAPDLDDLLHGRQFIDDKDKLREEIADSYLFAQATGVGMKPLEGQTVVPDETYFRPDLIVTDTVYAPRETETLRLAKKAGCKTMNGLGMMLFQGDAAFHLWTGKHMPIDHMKEVLDIKYD